MDRKRAKIMILEDDRFLSSLIKARLEIVGYIVIQAFDGEQGLELLRREGPQLLILDIILPIVTGFEVLNTISISPELKSVSVIALSNLAQESDIEKAKKMGAVEYFVKVRISLDDLLRKVNEILK